MNQQKVPFCRNYQKDFLQLDFHKKEHSFAYWVGPWQQKEKGFPSMGEPSYWSSIAAPGVVAIAYYWSCRVAASSHRKFRTSFTMEVVVEHSCCS
jgi:hypothetical protein